MRPIRSLFTVVAIYLALMPALFAAEDRGLFYRASAGGGTVYLLGSLHMATADFYPLRAAITTAFSDSEALVVEVNMHAVDPQRVSAWIAANGIYPDGETLRDHIKPETWARLETYLRQRHMDTALIAQQKPGLVVVTLSTDLIADSGFSAAQGIDQHFLALAARQHKPVLELEKLEQQLALLSNWPNPDLLINQTIDEANKLPGFIDEMTAAWRRGDAAALEKLMLTDDLAKHPEYRPLFEQIYTARNRAMTQHIKTYLREGRQYFVVVGAAHLVGHEGIVQLLKAAGLQVEQL